MVSKIVRSLAAISIPALEWFVNSNLHAGIMNSSISANRGYYSYGFRASICVLSLYPILRLSEGSLLLRFIACVLQLSVIYRDLFDVPKKIDPKMEDYFECEFINDIRGKVLKISEVFPAASKLTPNFCEQIPLFSEIKLLEIHLNNVSDLSWIRNFPNLKVLKIRSSQTELPSSIFTLQNLETLDLNCRELNSLPDNFFAQLKLTSLYIDGKNFQSLFHKQTTSLTVKDLTIQMSQGALKDLPNLFLLFPELESLYIAYHDISPHLPDWLKSERRNCQVTLYNH